MTSQSKQTEKVLGEENSNLALLDKNLHHTIDAAGKTIGRVASEAAKALMGKMSPQYTPNIRSQVKVKITNASRLYIREKKRVSKIYTSYTGYPGGLRKERLEELAARKGVGEPLRRAIERMLPRNTFRTARMKNLNISE